MTESQDTKGDTPTKTSRKPILLGLGLALLGAGGGFYATQAGILPGMQATMVKDEKPDQASPPLGQENYPDVSFLEVDPLIISLNTEAGGHLRFRAQLEIAPEAEKEVQHLMPRVVDVLNGYLRALDLADLQDTAALTRLRAQMLRRVQVVTGGNRVKDLLIMEFVLN